MAALIVSEVDGAGEIVKNIVPVSKIQSISVDGSSNSLSINMDSGVVVVVPISDETEVESVGEVEWKLKATSPDLVRLISQQLM